MASERGRAGSLAMQHRVNGAVKRNNDFTESASMRGAPHADQGQTILFFFCLGQASSSDLWSNKLYIRKYIV